MTIYEFLCRIQSLRLEAHTDELKRQLFLEYRVFEMEQLDQNKDNAYAQQFHSDNINVLSDLIENADRGYCIDDTLLYFYGYAAYNYMLANGFAFGKLLDDFYEQLWTAERKTGFYLIQYFALRHVKNRRAEARVDGSARENLPPPR